MDQRGVILIVVDGLRPDALPACGEAYAGELVRMGSSSMEARTVWPSMTLPCHMSLFLSVPPSRHGTTTNTYAPQVRPISGLCEQLRAAGKKSAFFYNWEELRDLARPSSLACSCFVSGDLHGYEKANEQITAAAVSYIGAEAPDFAFVYLGLTDSVGHDRGWMGEEYLAACRTSLGQVRRIVEQFGGDYTIFITADHGGHARTHGSEEPEDMRIPLICIGPAFAPGSTLDRPSICDIAPTAAELLGVDPGPEWEGKSLLDR